MVLNKALMYLSTMVGDIALEDEKDWDDSEETVIWLSDAIDAIEFAYSVLSSQDNEIGVLKMKSEEFLLKEAKTSLFPYNSEEMKKTIQIFETLSEDTGLTDEEQWNDKGFDETWRLGMIQTIDFTLSVLKSFSNNSVFEVHFPNKVYIAFPKN